MDVRGWVRVGIAWNGLVLAVCSLVIVGWMIGVKTGATAVTGSIVGGTWMMAWFDLVRWWKRRSTGRDGEEAKR
ncbi:MAG TPA: hypothetical protein VLA89_16100 [Gemmatimonadales bacterium]|nr:hypothetical protein [Gemmatimonadales bacterium]